MCRPHADCLGRCMPKTRTSLLYPICFNTTPIRLPLLLLLLKWCSVGCLFGNKTAVSAAASALTLLPSSLLCRAIIPQKVCGALKQQIFHGAKNYNYYVFHMMNR